MTSRVVAIGLDGASLSLIRNEIAAGRLSALASLIERGSLASVTSASNIGSGAVWPTFVTGTPPEVHGRYAEWLWRPEEMTVSRISGDGIVPFWAEAASEGTRVLTLDVPYGPITRADNVFEIVEWGAHDIDRGAFLFHPASLSSTLEQVPVHPYRPPLPSSNGPQDRASVLEVGRASVTGAQLRGDLILKLIEDVGPDLAIVVFPELHHAGHDLWHTYEPNHAHYGFPRYESSKNVRPNLLDVYDAVDHQIGRIVASLDGATSVFLFALHGLHGAPGVITMMNRYLSVNGYAARPTLRGLAPGERIRHVVGSLKRRAPKWATRLYKHRVDQLTRIRLAGPTIFEAPDFTNSHAFGLPVEWHGYARVNLRGREARGIIPEGDYVDLRAEIDAGIRSLRDAEGRPLVRDTYLSERDPALLKVPDVIAHWAPLAYDDALIPEDPKMASPKAGVRRTAEHTLDAFCIGLGPARDLVPASIESTDLGSLMLKALGS